MNQGEHLRWRENTRRLLRLRRRHEIRVMPGFQNHEHLLTIVRKPPTDFEPWDARGRGMGVDCSCGCQWMHPLSGTLETDWGVCTNPRSPCVGLLTFEHMGCEMFEDDLRNNYLWTRAGMRALRRFQEAEIELAKWHARHSLVKERGKPIYKVILRKFRGKKQKKLET